jgi:aspartate-semialdehyde dehydrogenase
MKAAVIGATGAVGQRFLSLLAHHPTFKIGEVVASERSAGKRFGEACTWVLDEPMPAQLAEKEVKLSTDDLDADVVFSAIPSGAAGPIESDLAKRGHKVFSNAKDHRMDPKVPLLLAEVNPDHAQLVKQQGSDGYVVTNGNCTTIVLTMALKPLMDSFGLTDVMAVSMQALSGAGYPGVPSLDIQGNVVPYIGGEEEKVESETLKFLGSLRGGSVQNANIKVSATCTRVAVTEGHSLAVSVKLSRFANAEEIIRAWESFRAKPQQLKLPSAPIQPVHYFKEPNRPQPRKEWNLEKGMAISVGRLRKDPILGWKFFCSGSNTIRGAAGGSILNAELMKAEGLL